MTRRHRTRARGTRTAWSNLEAQAVREVARNRALIDAGADAAPETRQALPAQYAQAGPVTVRRADGSVDVQPAYTPRELRGISGLRTRGAPDHLKITLKTPGDCCVCSTRLRKGDRAWWWPRLHLISCERHKPRTPTARFT